MSRLNLDERNVDNAFDIILDENLSDNQDNEREDERIQRLAARVGRRTSKKYLRPIFREPGSKIPEKDNDMNLQHKTFPLRVNRKSEIWRNNKIPMIDRYETRSPTMFKRGENIIHPSSYHISRLEYIVGKPAERYKFDNGDNTITLRTRRVQNMSTLNQEERQRYIQYSNCGSSIATVSDLDSLEAKTLRRKRPNSKPDKRNLNLLRQEINKIVSSSLDRREPEASKSLSRRSIIFGSLPTEEEERDGYEGCTSHGCASFLENGVGPEMQDFISDMKTYWIG